MSDTSTADAEDRPNIQRLASTVSWIVFAASSVGLIWYAWPQIQSQLLRFLTGATAEQVRYPALVAYAVSWAYAMLVDTRIQRTVYRDDPEGGKLTFRRWALIAAVLGLAIYLFWAIQTEAQFVFALNAFFFANVLLWWLAVKIVVRPLIDTNRCRHYETEAERTRQLEKLGILDTYITGYWQWFRFAVMFLIILLLDLLFLVSAVRNSVGESLESVLPWIPVGRANALLVSTTFVLFVFVAETWNWTQRARAARRIRRSDKSVATGRPGLVEYMTGFFEQRFKALNYLMLAHGAAFATCLTLQKDYFIKATEKPQGPDAHFLISLEPIVALFAWGLVFAILGYIMLSVAHDSVMSAIRLNSGRAFEEKSSILASFFTAASALILLVGILTAASALGRSAGGL